VTDVALRRATPADADALAEAVVDGLADYPAFAPPGWTPPSAQTEADHLRTLLADERVVSLVAERAGTLVGQVTVLPAARGPRPVDDPALAHLSNLIVDREHWGTGLASALNAAAVRTAREHGFGELRLFVAEGQARARRFYEREGWKPVGDPFYDPKPGLELVEYRIPTTAGPDGRSG
jgi:GNAT superfamily N-acetyltransferase